MIDLVLVHAFPFDSRLFAEAVPGLAGAARVHTPDLPGYGASPEQPVDSIDTMADHLRRYVEARGLTRFVLGGLSMGGYVAFAYWRRHARERRPAGLVFADTRAEADGPEQKRARDEVARTVLEEKSLAPYATRALPSLLAPGAPPEVVACARRLIEAQSPKAVAAGARALRDRPNSVALLPGMEVPALVVCGEADVLTSPGPMQDLASRLKDARYVGIAGAGHLPALEKPEAFAAALAAFLKRF